MFLHWMIKLLNVVFVFSLGTVTFWLLYCSLISDRVRRSLPLKRAELFLRVFRDGRPYLKIDLKKSHYLIGRGPGCDIFLKGMGIPLNIGELYQQDGDYLFKNCQGNSVKINDEPIGKGSKNNILPGDKIMIYNYIIMIHDA